MSNIRFVDPGIIVQGGGGGTSESSSYAETASFAQSGDGPFTGSFSGSFIGDASGTFSGSMSGTASFALTATSASHAIFANSALSASYALSASHEIIKEVSSSHADTADTASYVETAQTASYVETAQTASYVENAISSSFATTAQNLLGTVESASFAFTASSVNPLQQNVNVTGDIEATGVISASKFTANSGSSALLPGYTFHHDSGTGLYSANAGDLQFQLAGGGTPEISLTTGQATFRVPIQLNNNELINPSRIRGLGSISASGDISSSITSTASFGTYLGDGSQLTGVDGFPFIGDAEITGSLNVSGSVDIAMPSGSVFTIHEPDFAQPNRLDFSYSDGDPTLTIGSRLSVGYLHLRKGLTGTGFKIGSDGSFEFDGTTSFILNASQFKPHLTNTIDLGVFNRRFKDFFLYSGAKIGWSPNTSEDLVSFQHVAGTNTLQVTGSSDVNLDVKGAISASAGIINPLTASYAMTASHALNGGGNAFPFTGDAEITGSLLISSSTSESLSVQGSGSTVFDVIGSVGTLFEVTDSLTGSIFAAKDATGIPILEVFANGGNNDLVEVNQANFLIDSGSATITGSLYVTDTASISYLTASSIEAFSMNVTHLTSSFITSSTIQSSGSHIFGDEVTDTQTLVGTIKMSGSANLTGSLDVEGNTEIKGNTTLGINGFGSSHTIYGNTTFTDAIQGNHHLTINGDTILGNAITDTIELKGHVTASGNVSGSAASTASFGHYIGDGSQLTGVGGNAFPFTGSAGISGSLETVGVVASHLDGQFDLTSSIVVTVASKTANHRYPSGGGSSTQGYYFNSIESPYIDFYPGKVYKFDQSDNTNSTHRMLFYLDAAKNTQYTTNVVTSSIAAGSAGAYTQITVTEDTPSILYYQCINHGYMGNAAHMESSAVSASFAQTASFVTTAQTASYVVTAQTASYVLNAVSSSYALSASLAQTSSFISSTFISASAAASGFGSGGGNAFPFTGDAQITGSLLISGSNPKIEFDSNVIIGNNAIATSSADISIGTNAITAWSNATYKNDARIAIGLNASASEGGAIAIGHGAIGNLDGVAVGRDAGATTMGQYAVAIGKGSQATTSAVAVGRNAIADGTTGTAIGDGADAGGNNCVVIGKSANASGHRSVAIGDSTGVTSQNSVGIGYNADVTANGSIAIGSGMSNSGLGSIIFGTVLYGQSRTNSDVGAFVTYLNNESTPSLKFQIDSGSWWDGGGQFGFGTKTPSATLTVSGSFATTGSAIISSSNSDIALTVEGSGSTVFNVIGSQGTLFSVDDDLSGTIFTANDISGLPVLEASASGEVYIGKSPQSLYTTAVISSTSNAVTQSIFGLSTSSYDGAFFDYTVQSGSDARAGSIMAVWNGSNINFTETTTTDIGDTSGFNLIVHISQSQAQIAQHSDTNGYKIKTIIRSI